MEYEIFSFGSQNEVKFYFLSDIYFEPKLLLYAKNIWYVYKYYFLKEQSGETMFMKTELFLKVPFEYIFLTMSLIY